MASNYLDVTGRALLDPLVVIWNSFADALPKVLGALIILIIGYLVASLVGYLVLKLLEKSKIDEQLKKSGLAHSIGFLKISGVGGGLVKWYVFAVFLLEAARTLDLGSISTLLENFAQWLPNLLVAIIILLIGLIISDYFADRMLHAKRKGVRFSSTLVRWVLVVFFIIAALEQARIQISLAENVLIVVAAGISLAFGLAFGLGFSYAIKDEAKKIIKDIRKNW